MTRRDRAVATLKANVAVIAVVTLVAACAGGNSQPRATLRPQGSTSTVSEPTSESTAGAASTSPTTIAAASTSAPAGAGASAPPAPAAATAAPRTAPAPTAPTPTPTCVVPPQVPPAGTISANFATALAFAPDGRLFFTERSGTVRVVQDGQSEVFATVATVTTERSGGGSERGLLGLAIDPSFSQNRFVYAFYSDADYSHEEVIRWTDCGGVGMAARILIVLPSGADCCHKGGRLAFGPDGKLYATLGEEHNAPAAQSTSDVRGKVLRYNADGTVPPDNPFGPTDPVWVYGLRNPFGIAFSQSGQLAITNNGPSGELAGGPATGYDTVILSAPRGGGYQWPDCYGYSHPNPNVSSCGAGLVPDWSSEHATVVPTGATFVDQFGPAGYAGKLVVCSYAGGMLIFTPGALHGAEVQGPADCRLDAKEGPNHALYFSSGSSIVRLG